MLTINKTERTIKGFYVQATEDRECGFEFIDVGEMYGCGPHGWWRFERAVDYYYREAGASQITVVE